MSDYAYAVQQGDCLTITTTKPADPVDSWPPSACWPDGSWVRIPIDRLDSFLAIHASEAHAEGIVRKRAEQRTDVIHKGESK